MNYIRCTGGSGGGSKRPGGKRAAARMNSSSSSNGGIVAVNGVAASYDLDSDLSRFLPVVAPASRSGDLPPQLHPHSGLVPNNWEEFPLDPSIPDVTEWSAAQVASYFAGQGFPQQLAELFQREVR